MIYNKLDCVLFTFTFVLLLFAIATATTTTVGSNETNEQQNFFTFHVKDYKGNSLSLAKYRGKVTLVTNVASECGYTDQHYEAYSKMQTIFNKNRQSFNVLAFPSNQFGQQEPGVSKNKTN